MACLPLFCPFSSSSLSLSCPFAPAFISFPAFLACPLVFCLSSLFVGCSWGSLWLIVSFSLTDYTQKERAQSVLLASSLSVFWVVDLVGVRPSALVKFVIVGLDFFGYTFV